jgi:hypothetical protein
MNSDTHVAKVRKKRKHRKITVSVPYTFFAKIEQIIKELEAMPELPDDLEQVLARVVGPSYLHHVRSAARSLGLVNGSSGPTSTLERLIRSRGVERQQVWHEIVESTYPFLVGPASGGFDVTKATQEEITDKFKEQGLSKTAIERGVTFFRRAAEAAGILSPPDSVAGQNNFSQQEELNTLSNNEVDNQKDGPVIPNHVAERPTSPVAEKSTDKGLVDRTSYDQQLLEQLMGKFPAFNPAWSEEIRLNWDTEFARILTHIRRPN